MYVGLRSEIQKPITTINGPFQLPAQPDNTFNTMSDPEALFVTHSREIAELALKMKKDAETPRESAYSFCMTRQTDDGYDVTVVEDGTTDVKKKIRLRIQEVQIFMTCEPIKVECLGVGPPEEDGTISVRLRENRGCRRVLCIEDEGETVGDTV